MPKTIPIEIRDKALELYIRDDMSAKAIADSVSAEFMTSVGPPTVYSWVTKYGWDEAKKKAKSIALTQITEDEANRLERVTKEHLTLYEKIRKKAGQDLDTSVFDTALDAVRAAKIGAEGELEILQDMMKMDFVQQVIQIIMEEVKDSEVLAAVGERLRELVVAEE
jgi:transposase